LPRFQQQLYKENSFYYHLHSNWAQMAATRSDSTSEEFDFLGMFQYDMQIDQAFVERLSRGVDMDPRTVWLHKMERPWDIVQLWHMSSNSLKIIMDELIEHLAR
jgi:hypothetical protein